MVLPGQDFSLLFNILGTSDGKQGTASKVPVGRKGKERDLNFHFGCVLHSPNASGKLPSVTVGRLQCTDPV